MRSLANASINQKVSKNWLKNGNVTTCMKYSIYYLTNFMIEDLKSMRCNLF